ncbi:MAG: hypothetical protein COS92_08005 [Desulfobacterales bacterium CG07_land_8_20_14_0_80_52_14]|nr:MAG: hypothetical protein COX20_01105 [Desulfobacterales bacterium CG23_combo_of_CG06-09_8_20_14_all_52_9]PIU49188.1 MAG: hypothetical protein COS92_08005 [Desulfobacterales bacterium CG07_land_8_20_14_0_80_52_14]
MTQDTSYKRRNVFIKKSYQFYFILKFCLIILLGGVISTALVIFLSRGTVTTSFENGRLMVKNTVMAILPTVILTNAVTVAIVLVIAVLTVLYISHKIAGPMFRFEKELGAIAQGNLTIQISLRKKDQFVTLSTAFNDMTDSLRGKVLAVESEILQFQELAKQRDLPEDVAVSLINLRSLIRKYFKI